MTAVIFFHAGFGWIRGGFVGVDVFFVISGYLITGILDNQIRQGSFSLAKFYQRRILRLAPALTLTLVFVALVFFVITPPILSGDLLHSLMASQFAYANVWFYATTDYFNGEGNPLLHTWSLAVEEQFYLVLPVLVGWLHRRHLPLRPILGGVLLTSLLASIWAVSADKQAAFYLPVFRAWELLAGGLLALVKPEQVPGLVRPVLGPIGLLLVVGSMLTSTPQMPFPGQGALLPTLGTLLLILSASYGGPVNWLLRLPPLTWMGKISYSAYLVHWPVTALAAMVLSLHAAAVKAGVVLISVALGWLSWRLVEQPFRQMTPTLPPRRVFKTYAVVSVMLVGFFVLMQHMSSELWRRFPLASQYSHALRTDVSFFHADSCFLTPKNARSLTFDPSRCARPEAGKRNVLLMGDSHAANLVTGYDKVLGDTAHVMQATAVGCRPLLHTTGEPRCTQLMEEMLQRWVPAYGHEISEVVLTGRWEQSEVADLIATSAYLRRHVGKVTVIGPVPEFFVPVPLLLAYQDITGLPLAHRLFRSDRRVLDNALRTALPAAVGYLSAVERICPGGQCTLAANGHPTYFDRDHLTVEGVALLLSHISED